MSVVAHLEPINKVRSTRRGAPRLGLYLGSTLGACGSKVLIHNLSRTGLLLEASANLNTGDIIEVHLPRMGATNATVVRCDGPWCGCQFEHPISQAAVSAALLRSEPVSPKKAEWRRPHLKHFNSADEAWEHYKNKATPEGLSKLEGLLNRPRQVDDEE